MMRVLFISGLLLKFVLIIAKPLTQSEENALDLFDAGSSEFFSSGLTSVKSSDSDGMFLEDSFEGKRAFQRLCRLLNYVVILYGIYITS